MPYAGKPTPTQMQEFLARLEDEVLAEYVAPCWERGLEELRDVTRCVAKRLFPGLLYDLPPAAGSPYLYAYEQLQGRVQAVLERL